MQVEAGERIDVACRRLAMAAPASMVFNGIRVEASPGDAAAELCDRWGAEMDRVRREYEARFIACPTCNGTGKLAARSGSADR